MGSIDLVYSFHISGQKNVHNFCKQKNSGLSQVWWYEPVVKAFEGLK